VSVLFAKTLRDQKRALIGWGIGVAATAAMYVAFFPTIRRSAGSLDKYLQTLPDAVKQILGNQAFSTPAGYLRSEIFSILGPILFLVFAIGAGSRTIAGEEEAGTLDLLLSTPIRRRQVLADKAAALLATCVGLAAVLWATVDLIGPVAGLHIAAAKLGAACLMLLLVALSFGTVALALGCLTGRRSLALGITSAYAVFAFVINSLATAVTALKPLRPLSLFRWYLEPDPLVGGVHAGNVLVFVAVAAVALVVAFAAFERRDLAA
jgi:ABC-2 type transport system permease protein